MSFDQHHGFDTRTVPMRFGSTGFELVAHKVFQLGLNHVFVFRRSAQAPEAVISSLATHSKGVSLR